MKIEIHAKLEFGFTLRDEQIRLVSLLAALHCNAKCKGLVAKAADRGIYGLLII